MTTLRASAKPLENSFFSINVLSTSIKTAGLTSLIAVSAAHANETAVILADPIVSGTVEFQQTELTADAFVKCTELNLDAARLACYDKVSIGEEVTLGRDKKPLDIAESFKASISDLRPRVVFSESESDSNSLHDISPGVPSATGNQRLAAAGVTADDFSPYTPLSISYDLDKNSEEGTWSVRPHNPIYLMPIYAHYDPNLTPQSPTLEAPSAQSYGDRYDPLELKAQISLKTKVGEDVFDTHADVWFAYTQQMHWQVYNDDYSRPFRATDYMPEIFITQPVKADLPFNGRLRMLGAGAIHHSNGQSDPLSRSWNRVYLMAGAEWGKMTLVPKVWTHVKNESDSTPSDNPDITDYYGNGELKALYNIGRGETVAATARYNFDTEKGAIELDYTLPITRDLHGFIQIFHGYGESIIEYNDETTAIGVGISLNDWQGL